MTNLHPTKQFLTASLLLLALLFTMIKASPIAAQDTEVSESEPKPVLDFAVPLEEGEIGSADITMAYYELDDQAMRSRSTVELPLDLPFRWELNYGEGKTRAVIHYDMTLDTPGAKYNDPDLMFNLFWDGQYFTSAQLEQGENRTLVVDIPEFPLPDGQERNIRNNSHILSIQLQGGYGCDVPADYDESDYADFSVIMHNSTFVHLDYDLQKPELDLANFPIPIYEASLLDEVIFIVIPDEYSAEDLEVAASLSATLGTRTFRQATVEVVTVAESADKLTNVNAILVGKWESNTLIRDHIFNNTTNVKLNMDRELITSDQEIIPDDFGFLDEIIAPYGNANYTNLIVSGTTDVAVAKAAQAISVGLDDPRLGFVGPTAVIEAFIEEDTLIQDKQVITFEELGFNDRTYYNLNAHTSQLNFFIPSNWEFTDDPVLRIPFVSSNALAKEKSGITVNFNFAPVASVLTVNEETGLDELLVTLPREDVRSGAINRLRLNIRNAVDSYCNLPSNDMLWTRILGSGAIYLPHQQNFNMSEELDNPISPLLSKSNLSDVLFSLPTEPTTEEINGMADIAWLMGGRIGGEGYNPSVLLGEAAIDDIDTMHSVIIGTPLRNPMISQVNDALPQPFLDDSNELEQIASNIVFKLPKDFNIGLIETVVAPWNIERAVTVVTGTSDVGFQWSLDAFNDNTLFNQLNGNLAFMRDGDIKSINTMDIPEGFVFDIEETADVAPEPEIVVEEVYQPLVPRETGEFAEKYQPVAVTMPETIRFASLGLIVGGVLLALLGMILKRFAFARK